MKKSFYIDTNYFIRYFIADIKEQHEKVKKVFQEIEKGKIKGYISILVVNEIIWVLEHFYEIKRNDYLNKLMELLALKNFKLLEVKKEILFEMFNLMNEKNIDITDAYLKIRRKGFPILSFDKALVN